MNKLSQLVMFALDVQTACHERRIPTIHIALNIHDADLMDVYKDSKTWSINYQFSGIEQPDGRIGIVCGTPVYKQSIAPGVVTVSIIGAPYRYLAEPLLQIQSMKLVFECPDCCDEGGWLDGGDNWQKCKTCSE